jgi:hypothetical protein
MSSSGLSRRLPAPKYHRLAVKPTTRLGKWALGLAAASIVFMMSSKVMGPLGGFPALVCGLAGGGVALVAIVRRGERSVAAFAALVPFVNALVFLAADLFGGNS